MEFSHRKILFSLSVLRNARSIRGIVTPTIINLARTPLTTTRNFQSYTKTSFFPQQSNGTLQTLGLSQNTSILNIASSINNQQIRTVTKFSIKKGKRKTVKGVIKRFKRLDWGGWIRTHSGRHKKLWRKTGALKRRLRQHVMVNGTQSWLLDKMVTPFWRRPKNYVDDPYKPYHKRDEYFATRKTPIKY